LRERMISPDSHHSSCQCFPVHVQAGREIHQSAGVGPLSPSSSPAYGSSSGHHPESKFLGPLLNAMALERHQINEVLNDCFIRAGRSRGAKKHP
jgi:hypothetical protein